jgi:hypothetical protein
MSRRTLVETKHRPWRGVIPDEREYTAMGVSIQMTVATRYKGIDDQQTTVGH